MPKSSAAATSDDINTDAKVTPTKSENNSFDTLVRKKSAMLLELDRNTTSILRVFADQLDSIDWQQTATETYPAIRDALERLIEAAHRAMESLAKK